MWWQILWLLWLWHRHWQHWSHWSYGHRHSRRRWWWWSIASHRNRPTWHPIGCKVAVGAFRHQELVVPWIAAKVYNSILELAYSPTSNPLTPLYLGQLTFNNQVKLRSTYLARNPSSVCQNRQNMLIASWARCWILLKLRQYRLSSCLTIAQSALL